MTALVAELAKLQKGLSRIAAQSSAADEVPIRIHSRDIADDGAPQFSPEFMRYLEWSCKCEGDQHDEDCPATKVVRFRLSNNRMHRHRLQRALRQLREIAPVEYDIATLIVKQGLTYNQAHERINEGRNRRSQASYSHTEFFVLTVAACSKLVASY